MPDAPHVRDHFEAYRFKARVFLVGGRNSQLRNFLNFDAALKMIDVYDFETRAWTSTENILPYPAHAACGVSGFARTIVVAGGPSGETSQFENSEMF